MAISTVIAPNAQGGQQPSAPVINIDLLVTLDNSYATNGYPFDVGALLKSLGKYDKEPFIVAVLPEGALSGHTFVYDRTAKKLKAFVAAGTEVPNATDLSVTPGTAHVLVIAR